MRRSLNLAIFSNAFVLKGTSFNAEDSRTIPSTAFVPCSKEQKKTLVTINQTIRKSGQNPNNINILMASRRRPDFLVQKEKKKLKRL